MWIFLLVANASVAQVLTNPAPGNNGTQVHGFNDFLPTNLKDWIDAIQAVAVILASGVAIFGINAWRKEFLGKRKIELAEEVLALFYQAKDIISFIRQRFNYTGEGSARIPEANETPTQKRIRDLGHVIFERYNPHRKLFSRIAAIRYRFMAQFGADKAAPFDELASIMDQIFCAARESADIEERLERLKGNFSIQGSFKEYEAMLEENNQILHAGLKNDPIRPRLDKLVADIKRTCEEQIAKN